LLEALLLAAIGGILGFAANALSPRGLKLGRNYSPGAALAGSRSFNDASATNALATAQVLETQLRAEGLQLADSSKVAKLFSDPKKDEDLVIFVDARDDDHYRAGHIPGAFQLDHYHPENYLAGLLPVCQLAEQIVVYCKGGSCEDSEQTAIFLRDAGVPKDKLFVYAGGFDEWTANRMPVELGQRNSGRVSNAKAAPSGTTGDAK
jgi:rhodanese-related sulfurtransferase